MMAGDLVLVDAGAEFNYYASDITRVFPVEGSFNDEQRDIYDLVLKLLEINNLSLRNKKNPNGDIEVKIIGMRPGEKISEELAKSNSIYYKTLHPRIKKIFERKEIIFFDQEKKIKQFKVFLNNSDINGLRNFLNSFK